MSEQTEQEPMDPERVVAHFIEQQPRLQIADDGQTLDRDKAVAAFAALRAERDAAQQQIATLTEQQPAVKLNAAITALEALQAQGIYLHGTDGNPLDRAATETAVTAAIDAALQSTRPQEQP